jgi:uncharacterized repeat protein (TIGR01451 family)
MKTIALLSFLFIPLVFFGQFSGKMILSETEITSPYSIDAADIDNDGDKDIVVCGYDKTTLFWFENMGNNSFSRKQEIYSSTTNAGLNIKICDLNNDYLIDIIYSTANSTLLFLNIGSCSFSPSTLCSNNGQGAYVNAEDFDNDNDMDICLSGYNTIKWYKNNGNGNFTLTGQTTPLFNAFSNPIEMVDINNDNFKDVVVFYNTDHTVSWLPNNTIGWFDNQIEICNQDSLSNFQCGDIDQDGDIDILGAYLIGDKIKLYKNEGSGNFTDTIISINNDGSITHISIKDLDNDNDIDLMTSQNDGFYWYENIGGGNFDNKRIIDYKSGSPYYIYSDDFNGDGYNEIVYATSYIYNLAWYENLQNGFFSRRKTLAANAEDACHITTGDIDNDNDIDILTTSYSGIVAVQRNLGFGKFSQQEFISSLNYSGIMSDLSDIDNDGDNDIISSSISLGKVVIFENTGDGIFDTTCYIVDTIAGNWFLQAFDVDGDDDNDIFGVTDYGNYFRWIENDGTGTFTNHHLITDTVELRNSISIHVLDYDDDGDIDFVADLSSDSTSLFLNNGAGNFTRIGLQGYYSSSYESIYMADLDNDGDKDLIGGEFFGTSWHENLGNNVFSAAHDIPSKMRVNCVSAADIDGDGLEDIVSSTYFSYPDSIFWNKNLGGGAFSERLPISHIVNEVNFFTVEDLDSDGDIDIAAAIYQDNQFVYYQNCFYSRFKIKGNVFYDENQNGIKDTNDTIFLDIPIILSPDYMANFNTDETYILAVDTGSYNVSCSPNDFWHLTSLYSSYNVDISMSTPMVDTCNFGFYPATNIVDLDPNLISGGQRCDFDVNFWINIENTGTQISNGIIELQLDNLVSFVNSDIPPDSVIGNSIYWHYNNLLYFENEQINILVHMPNFSHMGETMTSFLNVYSLDSFGNIVSEFNDTLTEILECSYDPNDKVGFPIGLGNEHFIENDQELEYIIRFQNTGNAEAINVMIRDLIDENLDYTTIEIIASSFPVDVVLEYDNELVFRFDSIMLLDMTTSEINSHGFVSYRISPLEGLVPNTKIENTAEIYFDYNPPIITNTTLHTIECWNTPPQPVIYESFGVLYVHSNETVHWYLNDMLLFGELDTLIIPQDFGQYTVEAINQYGCSVFSAPYDILSSVTENNEKIEVFVYPNPFSERTNILCSKNEFAKWNIELYNITGSKIMSVKDIFDNNYELDMNGYEHGIYFGKITTEDGKTSVFKLILN